MIAKREIWKYPEEANVWAGKYRNSHNLLHWHYDCEFIYVEQGSIDVFCERKKHHLNEGDALFTDSGQIHYQRACEPDTVLIVIVFDYNIIQDFLGKYQLANPKLYNRYPIPEYYKRLRNVLRTHRPFYGEEARCIVCEMMIDVFRGEQLVHRVESDRTEAAFKRLLEDIGERYAEYTFEDAVHFMGMSDAYFSRYFKSMTGTTFSQYLNYIRTDNAIRLLRDGSRMTMTEIAEKCGFATIRNFNRIFKEHTGSAPSRLPNDYILSEKYSYPSEKAFNPTLYDCELIESCEPSATPGCQTPTAAKNPFSI